MYQQHPPLLAYYLLWLGRSLFILKLVVDSLFCTLFAFTWSNSLASCILFNLFATSVNSSKTPVPSFAEVKCRSAFIDLAKSPASWIDTFSCSDRSHLAATKKIAYLELTTSLIYECQYLSASKASPCVESYTRQKAWAPLK